MDALDRHLEGLWEALEDIYLSKEVDAPREKVEAVSWSVAAFKGALRAAGRAEGPAWERLGALERCVEGLPLEEMAALNEELRTLTEVLREKAEAPEDVPWMEVGEAPDWGQAETWKAPGAGADPTPVVAGGGRDQDGIGALGLPLPASVGASSFSTKEDTGCSRPVNSPGGASASGPPSGLGARRNWHKDVTQEARQCLVPKFAEDITGRQRSLGAKPAVLVQVEPFRKRGRPRLRDGQASVRNHKLELARSEQGR
nr:uncharacterized protein LOC110070445 [Pogona vitticeps]